MKIILQKRTKKFTIDVINLSKELPNNSIGWAITNQIVRSSSSVGANYRAVCRAKSDRDFISKMETVIEEADETLYWLEIIEELGIIKNLKELKKLLKEADELVAIFVSSVITIKRRLNKKK
ncbi:MAG: four helix bundle protein [Urechidicola sp.]|nr:four helix bundle protein [Urechidicola sp.]